MALVTRVEVKAALGITNTDNDAKIDALLDPVSAAIEKYARRAFTQATETERHRGGAGSFMLSRYPVASITSVTDKSTGSTIAATGYELQADSGILRRLPYGDNWADDSGNSPRFEVVYVGGPSSVPEDVKQAAFEWFASLLRGQGGLQAEKEGDYSYTNAALVAGVPPSVKAMLDPYRSAPV